MGALDRAPRPPYGGRPAPACFPPSAALAPLASPHRPRLPPTAFGVQGCTPYHCRVPTAPSLRVSAVSVFGFPLDFPFRKGYLALHRAPTQSVESNGFHRGERRGRRAAWKRGRRGNPVGRPRLRTLRLLSGLSVLCGDPLTGFSMPRPRGVPRCHSPPESRPPAPAPILSSLRSAWGRTVLDAPASVCSFPLVAKLPLRDAVLEAPASSAAGCQRTARASRSLREPHRKGGPSRRARGMARELEDLAAMRYNAR